MKNILQTSIIFLLFFGFTNCNQAQKKAAQKNEGIEKTNKFITTPSGEKIAKVIKSDAEWKAELDRNEYNILRHAGTERAFTGDLWDNKKEGTYVCRGCQFPLFKSETKFKSGTGWPSYYKPLNEYCISEKADNKYGWNRVEVLCARCDGHLGHVFEDGPKPTGLRYCINSASMDFIEN